MRFIVPTPTPPPRSTPVRVRRSVEDWELIVDEWIRTRDEIRNLNTCLHPDGSQHAELRDGGKSATFVCDLCGAETHPVPEQYLEVPS